MKLIMLQKLHKGLVNCQNTRVMGPTESNSSLWTFLNDISPHIHSYQPR